MEFNEIIKELEQKRNNLQKELDTIYRELYYYRSQQKLIEYNVEQGQKIDFIDCSKPYTGIVDETDNSSTSLKIRLYKKNGELSMRHAHIYHPSKIIKRYHSDIKGEGAS